MENLRPEEIEKQSFAIIEKELMERKIQLPPDEACVIMRCIHTTADFDYASTMDFSPHAVEALMQLIRRGADVVTDTNMALSGINKKELASYGCRICCYMADEEVAAEAAARGVTRARVSMEKAMATGRETVFVVGNAPTALLTLWEHVRDGAYLPSFVIGVPVGFVHVVEAKERILACDLPHIVNRGRKGGSNVAAAIMNAVLYAMRDHR